MLSHWEINSNVKGAYLQISKPRDVTTTKQRCVTSQKNEHPIYTAAEARNHTFNVTLTYAVNIPTVFGSTYF
jgi:hypothetical protein